MFVGLERLMSMGDLDRAQAIWDRAMTPEAEEHLRKVAEFRSGKGPDPGKYTGKPVDFDEATEDEERDNPRWTSASQDLWEENQRERGAAGLPREPHPMGEEYEE